MKRLKIKRPFDPLVVRKIKPNFNCTACPLHQNAKRPVWGKGPNNPLLMIVGEGPGPRENETGVPFDPQAPAGGLITEILQSLGVKREQVYFTNATRCLKPFGVSISAAYLKACKPYLLEEIEVINPQVVVLAGNEAMKSLIGRAGVTKQRGRMVLGKDGRRYFPILHPAAALQSRTPEWRKTIYNDLRELLYTLRSETKDPMDGIRCNLIDNHERLVQFESAIKSLPDGTEVVFDFETNSYRTPYHFYRSKEKFIVSGVALSWDENEGWYLPVDHRNPANLWSAEDYVRAKSLVRWFAHSRLYKVAQHLKFDYNVMRGCFGAEPSFLRGDTMLQSHLIDSTPGIHGLDKLAWRVGMGGYELALEKWKAEHDITNDYTMIDLPVLSRYAIGDSVCEYRYYKRKLRTIEKRGQLDFYYKHVVKANVPYADMEARGQLVDRKYLDRLERYFACKQAALETRMRRIARLSEEFNFRSNNQLSGVLERMIGWDTQKLSSLNMRYRRFQDFARTESVVTSKGSLSTGRSVLKGVVDFWPCDERARRFLKYVLDWRFVQRRMATNIEGLRKHICADDRVRSNYNLHGAGTGRRSGSDPNPQNIPRQRIVKRIFIASSGYVLVMGDYRQQEVRIPANLSGDSSLIRAFLDGKDIHTFTASKAYKVSYDRMRKVLSAPWDDIRGDPKLKGQFERYTGMRDRAKILMWIMLFGGGDEKFAKQAKTSVEEAMALRAEMLQAFPGLKRMFASLKQFAHGHGYARNGFGRRRYIGGLNSTNDAIVAEAERAAINMPIQGTGADMTSEAAIRVARWLRKQKLFDHRLLTSDDLKACLIREVHDQLVVEVKAPYALDVARAMKRIMESIKVPLFRNDVPYEADIVIGRHLGAKLKYEDLKRYAGDPETLYSLCTEDESDDPGFYEEESEEDDESESE